MECERTVVRRSAFTDELVADAQALFEERLRRPVSMGEARNMLGNLADYMLMLIDWEMEDRRKAKAEQVDSSSDSSENQES